MRCAIRCVITRVLPLPAPARIEQGPFGMGHGFALLGVQSLKEVHRMGVCLNFNITGPDKTVNLETAAREFRLSTSRLCE